MFPFNLKQIVNFTGVQVCNLAVYYDTTNKELVKREFNLVFNDFHELSFMLHFLAGKELFLDLFMEENRIFLARKRPVIFIFVRVRSGMNITVGFSYFVLNLTELLVLLA